MGHWYRVRVYEAHQGAGRTKENHVFMYASGIVDVIDRYRRMPGIHRDIGRGRFPDVAALSDEETGALEQEIAAEWRSSPERLKRTWYYPKESRTRSS